MSKNILFICSQNKLRSPTAEAVFAGREGWDVRSAGTNNNAEIPLGADDIEWADVIFVMEQAHKKKVKQRFRSVLNDKRLICLGIPDDYDYMDEELVKILKFRVPKFID
ncbi:MAG: hypothetical protein JKY60_06550 [Kordiimonadaceae bacterium]|nr:hypothetical protein [Kordiimonadaceae bacterium]